MEISLSPQTDEAVLNVNKPAGMTSFDVVRKIRKRFKLKKVGHAGTLDPFAEGVLLILVGRATKKFDAFADLEKEYMAEFRFGTETDTHDITGKVVRQVDRLPPLSEAEFKKVIEKYLGEIEQIPPSFSAIKHKGRRLYEYARKGMEVEAKPRKVRISRLDVLSFQWPVVRLRIVCSKGTYIRALARDMGKDLGVGAIVERLTRTRIGSFRLEDAVELQQLLGSEGFKSET